MRVRPAAASRALLLASCGLSLLAAPATAQTRIATFPLGLLPPASGGGNPGSDPLVAIGQSFRAPVGATSLDAVTYWFWTIPGLFDGGGTALLSLYAFSGTAATGAALYTSSFTIPTNPVPLELTPATWSPGIAVTSGALYIALLTGNNPIDQTAVLNDVADSPDNTTGGQEWICDAVVLTCDPSGTSAGLPLVSTFEATFTTAATSVPEPRTVLLLGAGLLGTFAAARRRASAD